MPEREFSTPTTGGEGGAEAAQPGMPESNGSDFQSAPNGESNGPIESGQGMPQEAPATPAPRMIPETDLNRMRSTYDRQLAQERQARQAQEAQAQAQLAQMQDALSKYEEAQFMAQISQLPEEKQQPAMMQRQLQTYAQQAQRAIQAEQAKTAAEQARTAQAYQEIEPVAKEWAINKITQQYGIPRGFIEGFNSPQEMKAAAEIFKKVVAQTQGQKRQDGRFDVAEGGRGGAPTNTLEKYRNTGNVAAYLREMEKR